MRKGRGWGGIYRRRPPPKVQHVARSSSGHDSGTCSGILPGGPARKLHRRRLQREVLAGGPARGSCPGVLAGKRTKCSTGPNSRSGSQPWLTSGNFAPCYHHFS
ncbi:hypothetical protein Dimus_039408 [Dionaea muscipula]